ncbi:MAG: rhamnan synthesis F family protein [Bacteroidota bacterium]
MFALLIHIYYHDSWTKIFKEQLKALEYFSPVIMINLCVDIPGSNTIVNAIKQDFPSAFIITTPNKGKDIGGKLALINFFLKTDQKSEFIIFLHDKISPHSTIGDEWRKKLFVIIDSAKVADILEEFKQDSKIGIVGSKEFIKNEFNEKKQAWETTNNQKLEELTGRFRLNITDHTFVAGTMFWMRSSIIRNFFTRFSPFACREVLEEGDPTDQYDGTYTHSWERIFCWLANDQQYTIKGI